MTFASGNLARKAKCPYVCENLLPVDTDALVHGVEKSPSGLAQVNGADSRRETNLRVPSDTMMLSGSSTQQSPPRLRPLIAVCAGTHLSRSRLDPLKSSAKLQT